MESTSKEQVVVVSYYAGVDGYVSSEWTDDKGLGLKMAGCETHLLCSTSGTPNPSIWSSIRQVSSLSRIDYERERSSPNYRNRFDNHFRRLLAHSVGSVVDSLERIVLGQHSDGRLSWTITAIPKLLGLVLRYRKASFLFLGGPSSAHLLSILVGGVLRRNCISEFQDPLLAPHMQISSKAKWFLQLTEKLLVAVNKKIVFTSRYALDEFKARNRRSHQKAELIYPGAPNRLRHSKIERKLPFEITLLHLGTLYGSRNLDTILEAVRVCNKEKGSNGRMGIVNIGFVEESLQDRYDNCDEVVLWDSMSRQEGLEIASASSILLLIQHNDSRSRFTIPYKFYDYLNLRVPTLALVNSRELSELSEQYGVFWHPVMASSGELAETLESLIHFDFKNSRRKLVFKDQILSLMEL